VRAARKQTYNLRAWSLDGRDHKRWQGLECPCAHCPPNSNLQQIILSSSNYSLILKAMYSKNIEKVSFEPNFMYLNVLARIAHLI
jgi:hypothetical protein